LCELLELYKVGVFLEVGLIYLFSCHVIYWFYGD